MTVNAYLWSIDVDIDRATFHQYLSSLTADERSHADRFHFSNHRDRFLLARGFLREVLARHLGGKAADVRLHARPGEKPRVRLTNPNRIVAFSLTRSSNRITVGVVSGREIGVDIESADRIIDIETVATDVFSATELRQWQAMDSVTRSERFYMAWTRKEALGKALGTGISQGPDAISVPLDPMSSGQWLPTAGRRWLLSELPVPDHYYGSLVIECRTGEKFLDGYTDQWVAQDSRTSFEERELTPPEQGILLVRRFTRIE